ncbi:MAG: T9SS type A sorting domain-containing protein [Bacteroidota bacterium]|nr:T9SS type A sorting domain-containing protein [Bacteroidota bacterium]
MRFNVYNMTGELIMDVSITQQLKNIETTNLQNGLYFYKL